MKQSPLDQALLQRAGSGDLPAVGELYDLHGGVLYALALTVTGCRDAAEAAVVEGFRNAVTSPVVRGQRTRPLLARSTLAACPSTKGPQMQLRCLVALTLFGEHTYREAATLLGMQPEAAAHGLRKVLRDPALLHTLTRPRRTLEI